MTRLAERALDIIDAVALRNSCSLVELAQVCGLPVSTAQRIVNVLITRGYLVAEQRACYRLGIQCGELGRAFSFHAYLGQIARRTLEALAKQARAHAHLAVLEDEMVTYLGKQRYGRTNVHSQVKMQFEGYCTAIGKVLLSNLPREELRSFLDGGGFVALTPRTITDAVTLGAHLDVIRSQGWALEVGETIVDLMCLAVPLRDQAGRVRAAISLSVIDKNLREETLLSRLPILTSAAIKLELKAFPKTATQIS